MIHESDILRNTCIFRNKIWSDVKNQIKSGHAKDASLNALFSFNKSLQKHATIFFLDFLGGKCEEHRFNSTASLFLLQVLTENTYGVIYVDRITDQVLLFDLNLKLLRSHQKQQIIKILHRVVGYYVKLEDLPGKIVKSAPNRLSSLMYRTSLCVSRNQEIMNADHCKNMFIFGMIFCILDMQQTNSQEFLLCERNAIDSFRREITCDSDTLTANLDLIKKK